MNEDKKLKPNILFIVVDAFRADRCFGKDKTSVTPNLDYLIKNGTYFSQAVSSADGTPAAFGSIFTALYPFKAATRGGIWYYKLNSSSESYISRLKDVGYHNYCKMLEVTSTSDLLVDFENDDKTYPINYRLYDGLGNDIIDYIKKGKMNEPWFYFVHIMDVHKPFSVPENYNNEKYGEDEYDRVVSSTDNWIGKIIESVDLKNTIIILTADHGDYIRSISHNNKRISFEYQSVAKTARGISKLTPAFLYNIKTKLFLSVRNLMTKIRLAKLGKIKLRPYEARSLSNTRSDSKRYLYDELFRVPLLFCGKNIPNGKLIKKQVTNIDIFPTLFDILGLENKKNIHGRSLIPLFDDEKFEEKPIYIESGVNLKNSKGVIGIRTPENKYFRNFDDANKEIHLFDLKSDPHEEKNIAQNNKQLAKQMEDSLQNLLESKVIEEIKEMDEDEQKKVEEELKKLGYL